MNLPLSLRLLRYRLPQAVTVQTPQGATNYLLGYDQVGSLKAVAAMDGPNEGMNPGQASEAVGQEVAKRAWDEAVAKKDAQEPELVYDRMLRKIYFHDGEGNTHEYEARHDTVDEKKTDGTVIHHTPIEYGRYNEDVTPIARPRNPSYGPGAGKEGG
jgi:hypothetical protein